MAPPKGYKHTPEAIEKIRQASANKKHSEETKEKQRQWHLGKPRSPETCAKISVSRLQMLASLTEEERRSLSASYGMLGKHHTETTKAKLRQKTTERQQWQLAIAKQSATKPERVVEEYLRSHNILYETQKAMGHFVVDFYLPQRNIVLEVQGCYWHGCPTCGLEDKNKKRQANDKRKAGYLRSKNYILVIVWEHELTNDFRLDELLK